ncbi:hypothetical protein DC31_16635 [Microbacterium sp. CH12i]|uniref:hypothetical protein n=1 Tax=Microbacterium sp. CH12i TaxID=1479651 RepID=UPI0004613629|nr:hypothetical protein [Microbacterium sp. CH12i]KDA05391.1 hypothetical protein DC31_16635 [Microbacterium sp. CH12i]
MTTPLRLALYASALIAATLLVAGCTASPAAPAPTNSPVTDSSAAPTSPDDHDDFEAAWLDDGRSFAVVTWGSSTCVPIVDEVTADGQKVSITLSDGADATKACTADLAPRASIGGLPVGVDPTKDVELVVTYGDNSDSVELDGNSALTGTPGESTDYKPSAGWFDDGALVLLTWGSSSCPPIVEDVQASGNSGTVTFKTEDRVCTMDMAPRATILDFGDELDDDQGDDFTLTLVGDNLDGTVSVRAN